MPFEIFQISAAFVFCATTILWYHSFLDLMYVDKTSPVSGSIQNKRLIV